MLSVDFAAGIRRDHAVQHDVGGSDPLPVLFPSLSCKSCASVQGRTGGGASWAEGEAGASIRRWSCTDGYSPQPTAGKLCPPPHPLHLHFSIAPPPFWPCLFTALCTAPTQEQQRSDLLTLQALLTPIVSKWQGGALNGLGTLLAHCPETA